MQPRSSDIRAARFYSRTRARVCVTWWHPTGAA